MVVAEPESIVKGGMLDRTAFPFRVGLAAIGLALTACSAQPPSDLPMSDLDTPPPGVDTPCKTADACEDEAMKAHHAGDKARAAEYFGYACDLNDAESCNECAVNLDEGRKAERLERLRKGCKLGSGSACANVSQLSDDPNESLAGAKKGCELVPRTCDHGARVAIDQEAWKDARSMAERGCTDDLDVACGTLGSLLAKGLGGPQDTERAGPALERGCKAGDENACKNWEFYQSLVSAKGSGKGKGQGSGKADAKGANAVAADSFQLPNATLTIGSLTADGFTIKNLSCELTDGGLGALLAGPTIAAALGSKKAALKKCSPQGEEARVWFQMQGGKTDGKAKASSAAVEACVVKVLKTVPAVSEGTCVASVDLAQ